MHRFKGMFGSAVVFTAVASALLQPLSTLARSPSPFKATIAISETIQPDLSGTCGFIGTITGTGQAAHMGQVTVTSVDCVTPLDASTYSFGSNQFVLTAANGDQLFATYSGLFNIEGAVAGITGGFYIVGGTGRFVGATGAGALRGVENISTSPAVGQVELSGTISY